MFAIMVQCDSSPRHTQRVPKWQWDGQPAGTKLFNTRARRDAQKQFPFLSGANWGRFGLLRNERRHMFEIIVQGGVFPGTYTNSAKWHLDGQPAGTNYFNVGVRRGAQKKLLFSPGRI